MAVGTAALAQKLVSKKSTSSKPSDRKSSVSKKNSSEKISSSRAKNVPWQEVADLYNKGLSVSEISDKLKLTRLKTKKGKENNFPYYLTVGYLAKLANGVEVNGKTIRIVRGSKNKKRSESKDK
jgi:hypothetical protein